MASTNKKNLILAWVLNVVKPRNILLPFFSLFLIAYFASADVKQNPQTLFKLGNEAIEKQDFKKAISYYEDAIKAGLSGNELAQAWETLIDLYSGSAKVSDVEKDLYYRCLRNPTEQRGFAALRLDVQTEDNKHSREDAFEYHVYEGKPPASGSVNEAGRRNMGTFVLNSLLREGEHHIVFTKFGCETETLRFSTEARKVVSLKATVVLKKSKTPIEYVAANGTIVDAKNIAPLENVSVKFHLRESTFSLETKSDSKGLFRSSKLPKGKYLVVLGYPTHVANAIEVDLAQSNTSLATIIMYNTKQITLKYSVTEKDRVPILNKQSSNVVITTQGINSELGSGFNFVEQKIAGEWYGPNGGASFAFTQRDNVLGIFSGMKTSLCKLGKVSWESVEDGSMYHYKQVGLFDVGEVFDVGDVFVFDIEDGKRYAKLQILKIEDREDIPQSPNNNK